MQKTETVNRKTYKDITDKFSQEEIVKILKRVGADKTHKMLSKEFRDRPLKYSVTLSDDRLVINNDTITNNATVIQKDGAVLSTGSCHCSELAPKGSFIDVFKEVQNKVNNK